MSNFPQIHLPEGSFQLMPVAELRAKFHPRNANEHPASQLPIYAAVLQEIGIRGAVILSALSGHVVKGHGAILTAEAEGWTHYPAQVQGFDSEEMELAFLLADNNLPSLSRRVDSQTAAVLARLREKSVNLAATGMRQAVITRLMAKLDADPAAGKKPLASAPDKILKKWNVKSGQVWQCGKHRVMCGDGSLPAAGLPAAGKGGRAWHGAEKSPAAVAAALERWTISGGEKPVLIS
jgi:hypothetical protein